MSTWFQQPTNANKLRQTYLKGFLDISGGGIQVRTDNSLNFFNNAQSGFAETFSTFGVDANNMYMLNPADNTQHAVPHNKLYYLDRLETNVQDFITAQTNGTGTLTPETANIVADASVGGRLYVGGDATFGGNVSIAKDLTVGGNLIVSQNEIINADLYVKGDSHFGGRVFMASSVYLYDSSGTSNLVVEGKSYFSKTVDISGNVLLKSTLNLLGDASMNSKLAVQGDASFNSDVQIAGTLRVQRIIIGGDDDIAGTTGSQITFGDALQLNNTLNVLNSTTLQSSLAVGGTASFSSNVSMSKDLRVSERTFLVGDVSMNSKLNVDGDVSLNSAFSLQGNAVLNSKLAVMSDVSLNAKVDIASTLQAHDISAGTTTLDNLTVLKGTTLNDTLEVVKHAKFDVSINVLGDAKINSRLIVGSDASLNGRLDVASSLQALDVSAGKGMFNNLYFNADNYQGTSHENSIWAANGSKDINIIPVSSNGGKVYIRGDIQVDGSINLVGDFVQLNTNVTATDAFKIQNKGTTAALQVIQDGGHAIAEFQHGNDVVMMIDYTGKVGIGTGWDYVSHLPAYPLDVSGNGHFNADVQVDGTITIGTSATKITITDGNLAIGGVATVASNLTITNGNLVLSNAAGGGGFIEQW